MSLVPRCPRCDAPTDPWGRDGGDSFCLKCREDVPETQFTRVASDPFDENLKPRKAA